MLATRGSWRDNGHGKKSNLTTQLPINDRIETRHSQRIRGQRTVPNGRATVRRHRRRFLVLVPISRLARIGWARCVAVYNRTRRKAEALAARFSIPAVYDDPAEMLDKVRLDFVDVMTDVDTHARFVHMAAERRLPVVCQKPLAATLSEAQAMRDACREAGVPLLVNENFRWQTPLRALQAVLRTGAIGQVFRGRIQYANSFPVFDNQPFLKELQQFILADMGTHILDVARFLFGEPESLFCRVCRVNPSIRGEDVATVVLGLPRRQRSRAN